MRTSIASCVRTGLTLVALAATGLMAGATDTPTVPADLHSAARVVQPERLPVMAATLAGTRVVAVGDYGGVLLSDDGKSFRQARTVPTRSVLTSVFFLDATHGWAAGHDATVLATDDGGETWRVLREEPGKERALLSVWFEDSRHGLAVGQFGLVVETDDGGKTWRERHLVDNPDQGDRHLMALFPAGHDLLFAAAESGAIFRSADRGRTWAMVQTDDKGSFWAGLALDDGSLLAVGLRGHVFRSVDLGQHWQEVASGTQQSLTAVIQLPGGKVEAVGMSGAVLTSIDHGASFTATLREDRTNLTSAVMSPGGLLLFSLGGLVKADH